MGVFPPLRKCVLVPGKHTSWAGKEGGGTENLPEPSKSGLKRDPTPALSYNQGG